jgi:hypothetical protein
VTFFNRSHKLLVILASKLRALVLTREKNATVRSTTSQCILKAFEAWHLITKILG